MTRFAIAYIANRYMDWCPTGTAESITLIDAKTKQEALDYLKEEWFKEDGIAEDEISQKLKNMSDNYMISRTKNIGEKVFELQKSPYCFKY